MNCGILLCFKLDKDLTQYKSNNLIYPVHLTLGYINLKQEDKNELFFSLKKLIQKKIKFNKYDYSNKKLSLIPNKDFFKIFSKFSKYIVGIPRGGFHASISINKKISVRKFKKDIKLPINLEIDKILIICKKNGAWTKIKSIS